MRGQRGPAQNMCPKRGWERRERREGAEPCLRGRGARPRCPPNRARLLCGPWPCYIPPQCVTPLRGCLQQERRPRIPCPIPWCSISPAPQPCPPPARCRAGFGSVRVPAATAVGTGGSGGDAKSGGLEGGARWDGSLALLGEHQSGSEWVPRLSPVLGVKVWGGRGGRPEAAAPQGREKPPH